MKPQIEKAAYLMVEKYNETSNRADAIHDVMDILPCMDFNIASAMWHAIDAFIDLTMDVESGARL